MSLEFDTPRERFEHGHRQLAQLETGYDTGALTNKEYETARVRIRKKYGLDTPPR